MREGKNPRAVTLRNCDMSKPSWSVEAKKSFALIAALNWPFGLWPLLQPDLRLKIRMSTGVVQILLMLAGMSTGVVQILLMLAGMSTGVVQILLMLAGMSTGVVQILLMLAGMSTGVVQILLMLAGMSTGVVQILLMLAATSYEMYRNCSDAGDSLDNLLVMASGIITLSKITIYHNRRKKLRTNVVSALNDWSSPDATTFRSLMIYYESVYKKITFLLLGTVGWCGSLYILKVILIDNEEMVETRIVDDGSNASRLAPKKRFLFPSTCALNDVSDTIHLLVVVNQLVQIVTCCTVAIGSDAFFLAIATHLCGQFEILKTRFAAVGHDENNSEKLVALISRHEHLLKLLELLEAAYNKIVLVQLLTCVTLISVTGFGFLMALKSSDLIGSVKSLVVIHYTLVQSFMYTCIGESLHSRSNDITQSVYEGSWYKLPIKLSRNLVFVMMRSNASPHLTAGKFFDMTRSTFMDVVKTSSSYLSILRIILND